MGINRVKALWREGKPVKLGWCSSADPYSAEVMVRAGSVQTTLRAGDYISIPAGMKHGYTVPADKPALLISMDAPPYDPQKTIR